MAGTAREPSMGWLSLDVLLGFGGTVVRNGLAVCFEMIEFDPMSRLLHRLQSVQSCLSD
jgi:hypothetical protein